MSELLDTLLADTRRFIERRTKPAPPVPASRADQIIAEGDRKRVAYRCLNPDADTAMIFGAQIGYLHGYVRTLCNELEALNIKRDTNLAYDTVSCADIPEAIVGYSYTPGEDAQTWGPPENCHEGSPEELELCEVWVNGANITAVLRDSVLEELETAALERARQREAKGREWDGEQ
jgi:hypothetical protein